MERIKCNLNIKPKIKQKFHRYNYRQQPLRKIPYQVNNFAELLVSL